MRIFAVCYQPLAALANLETNLSRSQSGHIQSALVTNGSQPGESGAKSLKEALLKRNEVPSAHQPTSHAGMGPNRSTRKSISARTRDARVRLGR